MNGLINNQCRDRVLFVVKSRAAIRATLISLYIIIFSIQVPLVFAQEMEPVLEESVNDLTIVAGAGSAGAIIGLSTLSFAKNPGDNLNNILVGGSIGIILGVALVAWLQASRPYSDVIGLKEKGLDKKTLEMPSHFIHRSPRVSASKMTSGQLPFFMLSFNI